MQSQHSTGDRRFRNATRPRSQRNVYLAILVLIVMVASVAGCRPTYPRLDTLRALPEANLAYPGSEEVFAGGSDGGMTIDGPQGAFAWRWLGADASPEEVERFYAEELRTRGWTEGGPGSKIRTTGEFKARAWRKGDVVFRLAFPDPEHLADPEPFARHQTIYDARLQESSRPRPSASPRSPASS